MSEREEIVGSLMDMDGEEGCGVSCVEAEVFKGEQGWKMFLEGLIEPWYLGRTAEEAKYRIKQDASKGFGLA